MASGASKYLNDLPSRGLFTSSTISSSNPGGIRVYVCQHDKTTPPEEQVIKTNATNILIRALKLKKGKGDSIPKDAKGKTTPTSAKGKRAAESPADGKVAVKRANNTTPNSRAPREEGSSSQTPEKEFQCYTVERLRAALKIRGLPTKGKKDDLIARLKDDKVDG